MSFGELSTHVPQGLVKEIKYRCDESGQLQPPNKLNAGDNITLISGPAANFAATIESFDAEKRIWVLVGFIGQQRRIAVRPNQIHTGNWSKCKTNYQIKKLGVESREHLVPYALH